MKFLNLRINTWSEARALADGLCPILWAFRGQQDSSWDLSPSLERAIGSGLESKPCEQQIIEVFKRRAHHFLPDPPPLTNFIEWLALLQHFGGPTRLLDFTRSFYVAAFFAMEKASTDSAIWCVNTYALNRAFLGQYQAEGSIPFWQRPHRMAAVAEHLIEKDENGQFVFEVEPFRLNERLAIQQGLFLCPVSTYCSFKSSFAATFGAQASEFESGETVTYSTLMAAQPLQKAVDDAALIKVVLPLALRTEVMTDLWKTNVTAATLFPGLDGFARSLHHLVSDWRWLS